MIHNIYLLCLIFSIQYAQAVNITEVDFYVSDDIPKDVAKLKIGESITNSSLILSNSSIPLSRETGNIYYSSSIANLNYDSIEFVMAQLMAEDSSLYKMLVNSDRLSVLVMTSSQSTVSMARLTRLIFLMLRSSI
uniref:ORF15 n=1 Tax=Moritella marina TaxID=90736 RepID=Q9RA14_MORMI|nr:unnamed protein product [Moritella marina ATCC 15381]